MFTPNTNIAHDYFRKYADLRFRQGGSCVKNSKLFCLQSSNVSRNQRGVMHPRSPCDDIAGGHVDHLQRAFRHVMDGLRSGCDGAGSSRPRDLHLHRRPQHHPRPHQGLPSLRQQVQNHAERWVSDLAREIKTREVRLGSYMYHRWMVCLSVELFLNSYFLDTVFATYCSAAQLLKQQLSKYTSCFTLAGSPPP